MPAPVATWDERLLGAPMWANYTVAQRPLFIRSQDYQSQPIYRRVASYRPEVAEVIIVMTAAQWAAFETFWKIDLDRGQGWFHVKLYTPGGSKMGAGHLESYAPEPIGRTISHCKVRSTMDWVPDD